MGTRADFYIKKNKKIEWLGSIAWDGYEIDEVEDAKSEEEYVKLLTEFLSERNDATYKEDGWPWPWNNSKLTDECYVFEHGTIWQMISHDGNYRDHSTECLFAPYNEAETNDDGEIINSVATRRFCVPDMSHLKNVASGKRSGLITVSI